jgi:hypoxanthine-guanine phosphoribosyltransferase/DNA-binding transcriptional ArsR family regulator
MKNKTKNEILEIIKKREQVSVNDLVDFLHISRQIIHRHLSDLIKKEMVKKEGTPPKVFYSLIKKDNSTLEEKEIEFTPEQEKLISENFFLITPVGQRKEGADAFINWSQSRNFDPIKKAQEYVETFEKYQKYSKDGLISGMYKIRDTFEQVYLDEVYYLDFYSIEVFGKTKLGQMMLYAKQSQDKKLIRELVNEIKPKIEKLIKKNKIDAVGFIPPSVKREVQFLKEIEKELNLSLPKIDLVKVSGDVIVPQKTLNKLSDRIENSKQIKLVIGREVKKYKNVLLIDDALGSGATLNEVARQIKMQIKPNKVIGLSITGSFSGFEIISEV